MRKSLILFSGWDRYRGGLDVHNNMTGNEAIYTLFEDHQVMFHVSTLLPYTKDDKQQVNKTYMKLLHTHALLINIQLYTYVLMTFIFAFMLDFVARHS